ncbi:MAG: UbiX family flavin prenyltransferase [Cellvibrionaceae bacterium]|nr:UbiX family flavin prenyltransferase [Cellvibrionaceae bacterium]
MTKRIALAITGASGAVYGLELLKCLVAAQCRVYLLLSSAAEVVINTETELRLPDGVSQQQAFFEQLSGAPPGHLSMFDKNDWFSPVASGSNAPDSMVICPASGSTLSAIASGASKNLIERAADVAIKERRQLIVVPREMPLSEIHLQNMLALSRLGVTVMPASPGFYLNPQSIDDLVKFVVARVLDHLRIEHNLLRRWAD